MKQLVLILAAMPFFAAYADSDVPPQDVVEPKLVEQSQTGPQEVTRKEIDPHTLIHKAILENSPETIRFLLGQGVDVDYADKNGMSPLTVAILSRCNYATENLLDRGANVTAQWNGMSLLQLAFFMNDLDAMNQLIRHGVGLNGDGGNGWSVLSQVIQKGRTRPELIEVAKNMIHQGAKVGSAEIYSAIISGEKADIPLVELMIQKGVDVNADEFGVVLVVESVRMWNANVIQLLVNSGANLNKVAKRGAETTALTVAITSGLLERVKFLVELGADVNQKIHSPGSKVEVSPVQYALEKRQPEIVQYLLQHGAKS